MALWLVLLPWPAAADTAPLPTAPPAAAPLVFMGDRALPPYEFLENGVPTGASVDLVRAVARVLGRPVEVKLVDWADAQARMRAGEADALTMLGSTPERQGQFMFSQPTLPVSFALFVRADEAAGFANGVLRGRRIGVTRAGLPREHFERRHPEATLLVVDSLMAGTRQLVRGEIDALAAQEWSQHYLLSEMGISSVVALPAFSRRHSNIAFRPGDGALAAEVDRALAQIKGSGEFDRIIGNWSYTRVHLVRQRTVDAVAWAGGVALLALLLLTGALLLLRQQKARLRQTQEQLTLADRRKDEFLATLAHELRNPLAPISNAARLLQMRGDAAPQARRAHDIIARQAAHLARLVEDLLDISRINTGKLELRKARVDLNAVAAEAVEASRPVLDAARHTLVLSLQPAPVWLDADPVRLAQVLTNLLTNAAKYMAPGGRVELATAVTAGHAVVRVRDEGVGVSEQQAALIFEMFYQDDRSLASAQGGLGIGLWLTRQLVRLHGGEIAVASAGPDRGSEFTVRLPAAAEPGSPVPDAAPAPATAAPAGRRVLVVDDSRDGAETLAALLGELGHQVETAFDGEQALRCGERHRPDLVFLDIGLPDIDGFEVCRRLRRTDWGGVATVVALTGWGAAADRDATRQAGFDAHLTKPASLDDLLALLAGRTA